MLFTLLDILMRNLAVKSACEVFKILYSRVNSFSFSPKISTRSAPERFACKKLAPHKHLWLLLTKFINISMDLSADQSSVQRLQFHRKWPEIWLYWHIQENFSFHPSNKSHSHEDKLLRNTRNHWRAQLYIKLKTANNSEASTLRWRFILRTEKLKQFWPKLWLWWSHIILI